MEEQLYKTKSEYLDKINQAQSLKELDGIFLDLFGKNGVLTLFPKEFPKLPKETVKIIAPTFSQVKLDLEKEIEKKRGEVKEAKYQKIVDEKIDLTKPVEVKNRQGIIHPVVKLEQEIVDLFSKLGFQQFSAPHIDNDQFNFELLNIPPEHPARDLWDTLYIDTNNMSLEDLPLAGTIKASPGELLLRTHTSNAQIRAMREIKPPFRLMIIDRCFRYENLDARHEHTFDQFEIVMVEKGLSMAHLQYLSEYFLKAIFGQDIKVRMIPKYYPFVEPGAGVEGQCIFCKGSGCRICGNRGWLELTGAGMIHPNVLKNGGIDPEEYTGIAWGFGVYRVAMLKLGVTDLRIFNSGDLTALRELNK